jgi:hypothetical protein
MWKRPILPDSFRYALVLILALAPLAIGRAGSISAKVTNGKITYVGEDGRLREIGVNRQCADLWVSPDEQVLAFIAIDQAKAPTTGEIAPFIVESRIYVALKRDHFRPVLIARGPVSIDGRSWNVFRLPSVSPDLKTAYFLIPATMASWKLMSTPLRGGQSKTVSDAGAYCVIWGGDRSGELLMLTRLEASEAVPFVTHRIELLDRTASRTLIAPDRDSARFGEIASRWARQHGGTCVEPEGE